MFLSIKYAGWFMCSINRWVQTISCNISRTTQRTNTGQIPACSQEPVDSTDANIVETSTCLETTQQEMTNFTVRLLIDRTGPCSAMPLSVQSSYRYQNICELGRSWGIVSMLKSLQKQLQRRHKQQCLKIHTLFRILMFFGRPFYRF